MTGNGDVIKPRIIAHPKQRRNSGLIMTIRFRSRPRPTFRETSSKRRHPPKAKCS
jgi:hypothetical protein